MLKTRRHLDPRIVIGDFNYEFATDSVSINSSDGEDLKITMNLGSYSAPDDPYSFFKNRLHSKI
jgi:hypothetical protein